MDPLLQLLGVKFLGLVALFGVSSLKGLTPYHPKTKNLKDSNLGCMQAKECLFFCVSLDSFQFFSRSLGIARLRGQILKFPVSGIRKQQSLFQFLNLNPLKVNFYFCEMVWNGLQWIHLKLSAPLKI